MYSTLSKVYSTLNKVQARKKCDGTHAAHEKTLLYFSSFVCGMTEFRMYLDCCS